MRFTALSSVAFAASIAVLYNRRFFYIFSLNDDRDTILHGNVHGYVDKEDQYHRYNYDFVQSFCNSEVVGEESERSCYYASILRTLNEYYVANIMVYGLLALTAVLGIQNSIRKGESVYARISHIFVTLMTALTLGIVCMSALTSLYYTFNANNDVAADFTAEALLMATVVSIKFLVDLVNLCVPSSGSEFRRSDILTRGGVFSSVCALLVLFTYGFTLINPRTGLYRLFATENWTVENDDGTVTAYASPVNVYLTPSHVAINDKWISIPDFDLNVENRAMVDQYTNNMTMLSLTLVGMVASIVFLNALLAFNSSRRFISNSTAAWLKIFSTVVLISVVHTIFATAKRFILGYISPKLAAAAVANGHTYTNEWTDMNNSIPLLMNVILAIIFAYDFVALVCETPYLDAAVQKIRDFNRPQVSTSRQEMLLADNSVATRV